MPSGLNVLNMPAEKPDIVRSKVCERKNLQGEPFHEAEVELRNKRKGKDWGWTAPEAIDKAYEKAKAKP